MHTFVSNYQKVNQIRINYDQHGGESWEPKKFSLTFVFPISKNLQAPNRIAIRNCKNYNQTWSRSCERGSDGGGGRWSPWRWRRYRRTSRSWSRPSEYGRRGRWGCNPVRGAPRCSGRCRSAATATATAIVSESGSARAGSSFSSGARRTGFSGTGAPFGLGFWFWRRGGREMEVSVGGGFWFLDQRVIGEERKSLNKLRII